LQTKQDVLHRLVDVWATGEASAALGFEAARMFDTLDPLEKAKDRIFAERKLVGRNAFKEMAKLGDLAIEFLALSRETAPDEAKLAALRDDPLVQFALLDALANVYCPACKLWNTGHGANMMREAVSLMGGYGVTEDCPGFLGHKWMDAQLEATYEGPEAVQRRQMSLTMTNPVFLAQFENWIKDLRVNASGRPESGACLLASAMQLWLWTLRHLQSATDANGQKLYQSNRQGVTFPLADSLCWLLASRQQILDVINLADTGEANPSVAEELPGVLSFLTSLCHVQAARAAGEVSRICADLVFGYNAHPEWTDEACAACYGASELDELEGIIPGIASAARGTGTVREDSQKHPVKAGPCPEVSALQPFLRLNGKLNSCLTGSRLAKDRAAIALSQVMIPEALDYPQ
jgi:alkylation response protein AidB-like acyl-CoA dehydrogenase